MKIGTKRRSTSTVGVMSIWFGPKREKEKANGAKAVKDMIKACRVGVTLRVPERTALRAWIRVKAKAEGRRAMRKRRPKEDRIKEVLRAVRRGDSPKEVVRGRAINA